MGKEISKYHEEDDMGFYEVYVALMGNLRDKPDRATPYKIEYLKRFISLYHLKAIEN